jgi:hypothetical protein
MCERRSPRHKFLHGDKNPKGGLKAVHSGFFLPWVACHGQPWSQSIYLLELERCGFIKTISFARNAFFREFI